MSSGYIQKTGTPIMNVETPEKAQLLIVLNDKTFFMVIGKPAIGNVVDVKGYFVKGPLDTIRKSFRDMSPQVEDVLSISFPITSIKFIQNLTYKALSGSK